MVIDVLGFKRPAPATNPKGRMTLFVAVPVAGVSALVLAFFVGRYSQADPSKYPFIVTAGGAPVTILKAAPLEGAQKDVTMSHGETIFVDCYVKQSDGLWYRLSDNEGWLRDDEVVPAPYTGGGSPPRCPQ